MANPAYTGAGIVTAAFLFAAVLIVIRPRIPREEPIEPELAVSHLDRLEEPVPFMPEDVRAAPEAPAAEIEVVPAVEREWFQELDFVEPGYADYFAPTRETFADWMVECEFLRADAEGAWDSLPEVRAAWALMQRSRALRSFVTQYAGRQYDAHTDGHAPVPMEFSGSARAWIDAHVEDPPLFWSRVDEHETAVHLWVMSVGGEASKSRDDPPGTWEMVEQLGRGCEAVNLAAACFERHMRK